MVDTVERTDIVPRSEIAIGVDPGLRGSLARLARGRKLVIAYFASRTWGWVIGDFSLSWRSAAPDRRFQRLAPLEGVDLYADDRLLDVLANAGPELHPGSFFRRDTPTMYLGFPELWIDFLEGPRVLAARAEDRRDDR